MPPIILSALTVVASTLGQSPAATYKPIMLDSRFDDWELIQPTLVDPEDAPGAFVDLGEVRLAVDDNFVHLMIDFGRTVNVQGLDGVADIILNADGDETTGATIAGLPGADLIVRCTPRDERNPDRPGRGMAILSTTYTPNPVDLAKPALNPYDIGLAFAPTHSGRRMEFRLQRGVSPSLVPATALPPLFVGASFSGKVVFQSLDGAVADETDVFRSTLPARPATATTQPNEGTQPVDPTARAEGADVRVVSWNAELGAIISRPEPFIRTLNALQPDVILMQELTDKITQDQVLAFLQHIGGDRRAWTVLLGKGGGDLRCAVFSRLPIESVAGLELVTYPERPDRSLRVTSGLIDVGGRKIVVASVHLKCCGRDGSSEDVTRLHEVEIIHAALKKAAAEAGAAGLIVAGDYNLVGSRSVVENMMTGLDLDNSNLEAVDAYQIDGRSNATWSDRKQPFVPGRLDWALYSDSSLRPLKSFVYDATDIAPKWHAAHGTQADDTATASDHLPVVFDLTWNP